MKKELPIVAPEGYEIDKERMVFVPKEIDLFPEKYEFNNFYSWYDFSYKYLYQLHMSSKELRDKILAFMKLIELRDEVNRKDGFVVDWENDEIKWCITMTAGKRKIDNSICIQTVLAFRTREIAKQFADKYADLINQCPDLI